MDRKRIAVTTIGLTSLTALLVLAAGCGGGSEPRATTPDPAPGAQGLPLAPSGTATLGAYELSLDFDAGVAILDPIQQARSSEAIGDLLAPDITPYLQESPCLNCFQVEAISLDPDRNLLVDFGLRHPFPATVARADLSVFDVRAIVIAEGATGFAGSPKIHTNNDGTPDLGVSGNFDLLRNADGYTSHFDEKVANPAYFDPPLFIPGSVNPFIQYFTEANPSPTINGFPIAAHRFAQAPVQDVKRFQFALPADSTQLRVIVVLEARYGVSATKAKTVEDPTQLGSRLNPVYFLPAFNQPEAYRVEVTVDGTFTEGGAPDVELPVTVEVEDWQAGLVGNGGYGDMSHPEWISTTSDVTKVTLEIPGLQGGVRTRTAPASGGGGFGDPYIFNFNLRNELAATAGEYLGLISVVDDMDGQAESPTAVPGESVFSFVTYKTFSVTVEGTTGTNTPPTAVADAQPNPVASGATVSLLDGASFDPDAGDSITKYEWDFDISDGRDYTDSISADPDEASTSYTNSGTSPITITASLRVTDGFAATDTEDIDIVVNAPTGGNNPPTAVADAEPLVVASGATVDLIDRDSFDPDAGDSIVEYAWDFDISNGATYTDSVETTADQASTTYSNTGASPITITASLRVKDEGGLTDTDEVVITVNPAGTPNNPPVAIGAATPNPVASGATVDLIDRDSFDPDAGDSIVEYAWDFDVANGRTYTDAVNATEDAASTSYTNPGTSPIIITAALRVKDESGLTDTEDVAIVVNPAAVGCNATPPAVPANFRVPALPQPPYDTNFITFAWDEVDDPCVVGYAVYRSFRWGVDNTFFLLTDADGDNQIDANEVIDETTWADDTLDDPGDLWVTNTHFWYVVKAVKDTGSSLVTSANSKTIFVYFNDFEDDTLGTDNFIGIRDGEVFGRRASSNYPSWVSGNNTGDYGWGVSRSDKNTGTRCLDESANTWAGGGYGPLNNAPYDTAVKAWDETFEEGYWNVLGPVMWTGYENNAIPSTATSIQMQIFHRYQLKTVGGNAEDVGYVAAFNESDWEGALYKNFKYFPILSGKGYDIATPSLPAFLDQQYLAPESQDADEQIPPMPLFAGDFATPGVGAPNWTKTVFDLTLMKTMARPALQFCFAGDQTTQGTATQHPGWSVDDIVIVAY